MKHDWFTVVLLLISFIAFVLFIRTKALLPGLLVFGSYFWAGFRVLIQSKRWHQQ